jgi:hypothetical protein
MGDFGSATEAVRIIDLFALQVFAKNFDRCNFRVLQHNRRKAAARPSTNAFDRYGLVYRRRGSALKYDFAANYRYVGLDVLDLILRHGHVIRRENH